MALEEQNRSLAEELESLQALRQDTTAIFYALDGWGTVADGYKRAGDMLADAVSRALPEDSPLIFPMLFCYRQFVELSAKDLIREAGTLSEEPLNHKDFVHWLDRLVARLDSAVPSEFDSVEWVRLEDGKPAEGSCPFGHHRSIFQEWCARFATADPDSFRFRYPMKKDLSPHAYPDLLEDLHVADIPALKKGIADFDHAVQYMLSTIAALGDHKDSENVDTGNGL